MALADIPVRVQDDDKQFHIADHNRYRMAFNQAVYSAEYSTLQAAIDAAAAKARPLIIEPKMHTLPLSPLTLKNLYNMHVYPYGAFFVTTGNMPAMLEMKDCTYSSWHGGRFKVNPGHVVDNAVYIYKDTIRSSHIKFEDVQIEGDYTTGLRVGKQLDIYQCDDTTFNNLTVTGLGKAGQTGVYVGTGVYSNCLNHWFNVLSVGSNEVNLFIDQTNAYVMSGELGHADIDIKLKATTSTFRNLRCEGSKRFLVAKNYSAYNTSLTVENVEWTAENIADDGKWIEFFHAGTFIMNQVSLSSPAHPPVIHLQAGAPMRLSINGLATPAAAADAFLLGTNASVQGNYTQADGNGVIGFTTL